MRALSERVAQRCEDAAEPVCKCRCGGALHGARRGNVKTLPLDDPHSPAKKCRVCRGEGKGIRPTVVWADGYSSIVKKDWICDRCGGTGKVLPR